MQLALDAGMSSAQLLHALDELDPRFASACFWLSIGILLMTVQLGRVRTLPRICSCSFAVFSFGVFPIRQVGPELR